MAYDKYEKLKLQYTYGPGEGYWADVIPPQYKAGELIEKNSPDCGGVNRLYRWYALPDEFICDGYNKYYKEVYQISTDEGFTWENVKPLQTRTGQLIEANSIDCGYGITWELVEDEYICEETTVKPICGNSPGKKPTVRAIYGYVDPSYTNNGHGASFMLRKDTGMATLEKEVKATVYTDITDDNGYYYFELPIDDNYFNITAYNYSQFRKIYFNQMEDYTSLTSLKDFCYNSEMLIEVNFNGLNTRNVTTLQQMFHNCPSLICVDFTGFNTANVQDMRGVFEGCSSLETLDLSSFSSEDLRNISDMFKDCQMLNELDLSNLTMKNLYYMDGAFNGCSNLETLNISNWSSSVYNETDEYLIVNKCYSLHTIVAKNCSNIILSAFRRSISYLTQAHEQDIQIIT